MTMRSKQWYPKTRKRAKSFSQVSSVASSDGLAGYQNHLSRRPVELSLPEAVIAFFASWRLGERKREATVTENAVAKEIVDAAFRVHTTLGPGLLESVYQTVLAYELGRRGLRAVSQQTIPVVYENVRIDTGFRADLVVEDKVIVEIKSVELFLPVHKKQLLTYLRLADKRLGLPINFHVALIKDGITRIVNGLEEDDHAKSPGRKEA
jgi:GxxExxY protein